jgi:serine/threonine-protein kinase
MSAAEQTEIIQPTIVYSPDQATVALGPSNTDGSMQAVGVVAGDKPHFAAETAVLLRTRLRAVGLLLSLVLLGVLLVNSASSTIETNTVRVAALVLLAGCCGLLWSSRPLTLMTLRILELVIFGSLAMLLVQIVVERLIDFGSKSEAASATASWYLFIAAWSLLLLTYGIFVPNNLRRALAILLPSASIPYIVLWIVIWEYPSAGDALAADHIRNRVPIPFVAVAMAAYGSYIINAIRREAFKARQLGQYRLLEKLGTGGMGEVYKAEHQLLKRPCAIKLIKPGEAASANALARFEQEVKATAKLTHVNTVEIFDYGRTDDGTFYYVMELLRGLSLEDLVKQHGPLPAERVVYLLRQVCGALQEAHVKGLIHRDIKPANIYAAERGGVFDVAKLLDFGLVKEATAEPAQASEKAQSFSGSPLYMAPEQSQSYEQTDARGDIYAVGAVGYFLLTGQPPFMGRNILALIAAHAREEVVWPSRLRADVPVDLEAVILRCLQKKPEDRFADANALEAALAACACAMTWNAERAAQWWREQEPRSK